jgi:hypothetical protein
MASSSPATLAVAHLRRSFSAFNSVSRIYVSSHCACGARMSVIALILDSAVNQKILQYRPRVRLPPPPPFKDKA